MENVTREERYLTAIATGNTAIMPDPPLTRTEKLLKQIAERPSGEEALRMDEEQLEAIQNKLDTSLNVSAIANTTQTRIQITNNDYRYPQGMSAYIGNDGTGVLVIASITHDESITDPVQYLVYDINVKTNSMTYVRQQKLDTGHTNSLSFIDESHLVVLDGTTMDVSILDFEENVLSISDTITIDIPTELESVITAVYAIKYKKDTNEFVALLQSNDSNKYYAILDRNFNIKRVFRTQKFTGSTYNSFGVDSNYIYQGLTTNNKSYVLTIDYNGNIVGKEPVFPDFDTEIEDIEVIAGYCVLASCYFALNGHRNVVTFSKPNIGRNVYGGGGEMETMTKEEMLAILNGGGN